MGNLELPAMHTFQDARRAMDAYDVRYWKHAPGLPTVRHTMIHLCLSLSRERGLPPFAVSGLALEHAARLANTIPAPYFDCAAWYAAERFPLRIDYVENATEFERLLHKVHADLNSVVHDMEEQIDAQSVGTRLSTVFMELLRVAMLARQYAHGKDVLTPRQRFGGLEARLAYLYGTHDINIAFPDPVLLN